MKKHGQLLSKCFKLHIEINNESDQDDLQRIERYFRKYPPIFTAAGYFQMNQGLFSSFCSEVVTYIIIIVQLISVEMETGYFPSSNTTDVVMNLID